VSRLTGGVHCVPANGPVPRKTLKGVSKEQAHGAPRYGDIN
jgi:hypothetical protein